MIGLIRHRRAARLLSSYIDGQVTPAERGAVEKHLGTCDGCTDELAELIRTASLMSGLSVLEPASSYALSSQPGSVPSDRPSFALWAPGIAAAACAVFLAVVVSGQAAGLLVQSGGSGDMFESDADSPVSARDAPMAAASQDAAPEEMAEEMAEKTEMFSTQDEAATLSEPETSAQDREEAEPEVTMMAADDFEAMAFESALSTDQDAEIAMEVADTARAAEDKAVEPPGAASKLELEPVVASDPASEETAAGLAEADGQSTEAGTDGVSLPLWQIEVGVGAALVLLVIAAYFARWRRRRDFE